MARGRRRRDEPSHFRSARRDVANAGGLEALGTQMRGGASRDAVANQAGLRALGERIDQSGRHGPGRGRWSTRRKVVTSLVSVVALVVVLVGVAAGFVYYELNQIASGPCPSCVAAASGAPYNVLVIGSDTRNGETAAEAKQFGTAGAANAGGQRSDTIKIVHV